jgi:glycosyltransferase involved in cell wall biosynthesis
VVVSDIPVLRELVTDSGGGLVARPDPESFSQAIVSLLSDPDRARALGDAGHAYWREQLTPAAVAERHLSVYARLLRGAVPSPPAAGDAMAAGDAQAPRPA